LKELIRLSRIPKEFEVLESPMKIELDAGSDLRTIIEN